jgi:tRNA (guanine37-N1)-methyltransferase
MRFGVVTIFPEMFAALTGFGVAGRAVREGLAEVAFWNPRDFTRDRHRTVDDRPYGGGPGMVIAVEPMRSAIRAARRQLAGPTNNEDEAGVVVSLLSPQGRLLDEAAVRELAGRQQVILVCGRYEGLDERLVELEIDEEWSIGDYVLSGGELAAAVLIDAMVRRMPGVLGDEQSAEQDSFAGGLLDCPHYTRPEVVSGLAVPPVLLSGDHQAIARWRRKQSLGRTWLRRPDLLDRACLSGEDEKLLAEFRKETSEKPETQGFV